MDQLRHLIFIGQIEFGLDISEESGEKSIAFTELGKLSLDSKS